MMTCMSLSVAMIDLGSLYAAKYFPALGLHWVRP